MEKDLIDALIGEWHQASPELNTDAMAVIGRLIHIGDHLKDSASQALKPHGLAYTDFDILATLRRSPSPHKLTPTELSNTVLLTSGAMTAALRRLEDKSLISRPSSTTDARIKAVQLTEAGSALAALAAKTRFEEASARANSLNTNEQDQLATLLRKLILSLDSK